MVRVLAKIALVLGLVLGGWWWVATAGMQRGVEAWLQASRADGLQAGVERMARGGFPLRIATTLENSIVSDPETGTAIEIPKLDLSAPIYWPGDLTAQLPSDPVTVTTRQGPISFTSDGVVAAMRLHPGTSLQLEGLALSGSALAVDLVEGRVLSLAAFDAHVQQGDSPQTYHFDLTARGLAPGSILQQALNLPPGPATAFAPVIADLTVSFDRPWDRSAIHAPRPQPRAIRMDRLEAAYGTTGLTAVADLTVDADGTPTGKMRVTLRDWRQLFDRLNIAAQLPEGWSRTVENMLTLMSDDTGTLDLELTFEQGQMRMGFIQLGPAPRIVIP